MINLADIIAKHQKWLNGDPDGERANLSGADLSGADLIGANLIRADLRGATLSGAYLIRAILYGANLYGANLNGADLNGAYLIRADLNVADLRGANLIGANLAEADLNGADLREADINGADLRGAMNAPYVPMACPDEGEYTAYKKARGDYIVVLHIPSYAKRSSASGRKCRCDKANVIRIENLDGSMADVSTVYSTYDDSFGYTVGETVTVENFDDNRWNECAPGIHHFMNRQEAIDYVL